MRTTARHGDRRGAVVATLLVALLGGCVVSPQPSPPVRDPILDGGLVGVTGDIQILRAQVVLEGKPGAVEPPQGEIVVTNLDATDAPVVAAVNGDGSFTVSVTAGTEHVLRVQVKQGERRSEPMDLLLTGSPIFVGTSLAHLPCLRTEPAAWVELDGAGAREILVRNTCAEEVAFAAPALRRGLAPFTVSPAAPFAVPAAGSAVVTVRADGDGDEIEDVLFLDVTAPEPGRRALTLTLPD